MLIVGKAFVIVFQQIEVTNTCTCMNRSLRLEFDANISNYHIKVLLLMLHFSMIMKYNIIAPNSGTLLSIFITASHIPYVV